MPYSKKYLIIFLILISLFIIYNSILYTSESNYYSVKLSKEAVKGEDIWLKNNCNSCHQIYGLGGYLGPDLTNVFSKNKKSENYIKTILNSGIKSMPKFDFDEKEKNDLVQFFKEIDQTGFYPNTDLEIRKDGWVVIKMKRNNAKE